jgi:hypothetical protein
MSDLMASGTVQRSRGTMATVAWRRDAMSAVLGLCRASSFLAFLLTSYMDSARRCPHPFCASEGTVRRDHRAHPNAQA